MKEKLFEHLKDCSATGSTNVADLVVTFIKSLNDCDEDEKKDF